MPDFRPYENHANGCDDYQFQPIAAFPGECCTKPRKRSKQDQPPLNGNCLIKISNQRKCRNQSEHAHCRQCHHQYESHYRLRVEFIGVASPKGAKGISPAVSPSGSTATRSKPAASSAVAHGDIQTAAAREASRRRVRFIGWGEGGRGPVATTAESVSECPQEVKRPARAGEGRDHPRAAREATKTRCRASGRAAWPGSSAGLRRARALGAARRPCRAILRPVHRRRFRRSASKSEPGAVQGRKRLRRKALAQTQRLDRLIARAPRSGCIFHPKTGYQSPAASGISRTL